jgi:hypothetical protein
MHNGSTSIRQSATARGCQASGPSMSLALARVCRGRYTSATHLAVNSMHILFEHCLERHFI